VHAPASWHRVRLSVYTAPMSELHEGASRVVLFGASGMIGQGVLRECLLDPDVKEVLALVRKPLGQLPFASHPKLRELVQADVGDLAAHAALLAEQSACFFCLGVSSAGMSEAEYTQLTHDLTLNVAQALVRANPAMTFVYVSGMSTDSTEQGSTMWARVKGKTENALLRLPFKAAYMFRPGFIEARHGIRSRTPLYRALYVVAAPIIPLLRLAFPRQITSTDRIGRAMLEVAKHGAKHTIVEPAEINELAGEPR
jgi:uncharacterized protein YbjT (DUF2867 family)